jgi:MYXO-CTERM domain-containing protein
MSSNVFVWLRAPLLVGATLLLADAAAAQECKSDDDCGAGYTCEQAEQGCATIDIACAPDDAECLKRAQQPCEPDPDYKLCRPASCEEDSDCPSNMACHAYENGTCASGTAPADSAGAPAFAPCKDDDCGTAGAAGGGGAAGKAAPPPPDCTTNTVKQCVPRYALPCEHDSDCGAGFKCKEQIAMSCAGSGAGGAGAVPPVDPQAMDAGSPSDPGKPQQLRAPECTSMPTGVFACELQIVECADSSACPADFECIGNPNRAACGGTASVGSAGSAAGGSAAPQPALDAGTADPGQGAGGGDDPCAAINEGVPEKICAPHDYYYGGVGRDASGELSTGGSATGSPQTPNSDPSGAGGLGGQSGSTAGSGAPPTDDGTHSAGSHTDGDMDAAAADSGCAVTAPGASGPGEVTGALAVLALCAFLLRRRARDVA